MSVDRQPCRTKGLQRGVYGPQERLRRMIEHVNGIRMAPAPGPVGSKSTVSRRVWRAMPPLVHGAYCRVAEELESERAGERLPFWSPVIGWRECVNVEPA